MHVFVSYSRKDSDTVDDVVTRLEDEGFAVWVDRSDIPGGTKWRSEIVRAIRDADIFLLVLSNNAVVSENVRKEVDVAQDCHTYILPIKIGPVDLPEDLVYQLVGLQIIDLHHKPTAAMDRLIETMGARERRTEKGAPRRHGHPASSRIRIADLSFTKPSKAPMGCMVYFTVSVTNVWVNPVTVKAFEIRFAEPLGSRACRWAETSDEGYIRMTHLYPRGAEVLGRIIDRPTYNPAIRLSPGDFIGGVALRVDLMWEREGEDDGTRYTEVLGALDNQRYELRAILADGSHATYVG